MFFAWLGPACANRRPVRTLRHASLTTALDRLRQFRATFNEGEPVDEESGLMADDLTAIINAVEAFGDDVVAGDPSET